MRSFDYSKLYDKTWDITAVAFGGNRAMIFEAAYCVERGNSKSACDDTALIGSTICNEDSGVLTIESPCWICLCDGVGGYAGGKEASAYVCRSLADAKVPGTEYEAVNLLRTVNRNLLAEAEQSMNHQRMATTLTGLAFSEEDVFLCHIGNTRLYSLRGSDLRQITKDQTTYQWLMDMGDEEAALKCNRNEITGVCGGGSPDFFKPLVVESVFEGRGGIPALLLTSDGVHEYMSADELERIACDSAIPYIQRVRNLCRAALANGSDDDRSAVIITCPGVCIFSAAAIS